jgi:hypothetical protein
MKSSRSKDVNYVNTRKDCNGSSKIVANDYDPRTSIEGSEFF